jgi:serine-type D-Ala-D-Ala carboxypeptidase/endopeptidase
MIKCGSGSYTRRRRSKMKRIFAVLILFFAVLSLAHAQDISGEWQGTLDTGMGHLRLVLHITKAADGNLKATLDSPDQGIAGMPVDSISLEGNKIHFTVNLVKGSYDGTLKSKGSFNGNWMQGQKMPLVLTKTTSPIKLQHNPAPPSDIDGTWTGTLDIPPDTRLRMVLHFKNTADGLTATFDSPDQKVQGWPATSVTRKGSSIKVAMDQVGGVFQGKLNKALDTLNGDWSQGNLNVPLTLKRAGQDTAQKQ